MSPRKVSIVAAIAAIVLTASWSHAAFTLNFQQVGSDVVATGSGTLNTSALSSGIPLFHLGPGVDASAATASAGSENFPAQIEVATYSGIAGPSGFGSGADFVASTSSGDDVALNPFGDSIGVPFSYASGAALSDTTTWTGETIAGLGITPGTYTWTWGTGATADSFTISAGTTVPEPASCAALGIPIALALLRRRRSV